MIVIQPLIQGLRSLNLYNRVYEDKEGNIILEIGKSLNPFWSKDKISGSLIFGDLLTRKEVVYTLRDNTYEKSIISGGISDFDLARVEKLIDSCYNFEDTHKVTDWK